MISCLKMFFQRLLQSTSTLLSPSDIDVDMVRKLNEKKKTGLKKEDKKILLSSNDVNTKKICETHIEVKNSYTLLLTHTIGLDEKQLGDSKRYYVTKVIWNFVAHRFATPLVVYRHDHYTILPCSRSEICVENKSFRQTVENLKGLHLVIFHDSDLAFFPF